jgi:IMP dehydrogenase
MSIREGLTFDDVLLTPRYSDISSRSNVDISVELPKGFTTALPIIPANMKSIMNKDVAQEIYSLGGLSLMHRFCSIEDQLQVVQGLAKENGDGVFEKVGLSIGAKSNDRENVDMFVKNGVKIICLDIAHAHSKMAREICEYVSSKYPKVLLMAGSIATAEGAAFLYKSGADVVRCNLGNGSICTTRLQSGVGVPQLTALMEINPRKRQLEEELGRKLTLISDGGCRYSGDVVKALTLSDLVMSGNMFAGCIETNSDVSEANGVQYREYSGSSTHKNNHIEGVFAKVESKGHIKDVMRQILEGVRSGCSYQGVSRIRDLQKDPQFIRITNAGIAESRAHDVMVVK